ncbi:DUF1345 domain-containing protein [Georgenia yuyongxinii]|uniref:DUF1345 domain-containing protein n=1 Tax=Georgenia yuyongxinii TaxID=2589797 RepID=A0A552WVD8_9MICO|nr:DUF1345 domain-containing protein [Georgenia yuyongxinii]TRW46727.1 DUF1345 domain-containing protein [Georgenia yuyongxinii]
MPRTTRESGPSAVVRLAAAAVLGSGAGLAAGGAAGWRTGLLVGWIVGAAVYAGWMWLTLGRMDGAATAAHAAREVPGRAVAHLLVLGSAVASLGAVALLLAHGPGPRSAAEQAALSVLSVGLAWAVVHTAFTARYADLYYGSGDRPIDFGDTVQPRYVDFAYLAFTVGMTFQVSDTQLRSGAMRAAVLGHALISYVLGVVAIAATVNLVAGLGG